MKYVLGVVMRYTFFAFTVFLILSNHIYASPVVLTENLLKKIVQESAPTLKDLEVTVLEAKQQQQRFDQQFSHQINVHYDYTKTNEQSLIAVKPVLTPVENFQVRYQQQFRQGMILSAAAYTNKTSTSNGMLIDGITSGVSARLTVDLYKNLWGKLTKANERLLGSSTKLAQLQQQMQRKLFLNGLRRIYWSLVANSESLRISEQLYKVSQKQLIDTKQRVKNSIADVGELARSKSQVAAREASLLYLKYQREQLIQQLKKQVPSLADREIILGEYSLPQVVAQVLQCTRQIEKFPSAPLEYTLLDDLVAVAENIYQQQKIITRHYSSADINLFIEAKNQAVEQGSYGDALSSFGDRRKEGIAVGINYTLKFGKAYRSGQQGQEAIERLRYLRTQEDNLGKLKTYHTQLVSSIELLNQVVIKLQDNSKYLQRSLHQMKRKYNQARISYREYIGEQNLFLESRLNEIKTKLEIINTLFDYFSVFTQMDCALNR